MLVVFIVVVALGTMLKNYAITMYGRKKKFIARMFLKVTI
jgi:hypothetical protein